MQIVQRVLLALTFLLTTAASGEPPAAGLQFGMVIALSDTTGCIAGTGLRIAEGDSVSILAPEFNEPLRVRVARKLLGECLPNQGVFGDSVNSYAITFEAAPDTEWSPALALGIPGPPPVIRVQDNHVLFWMPGLPDTFLVSGCTSMEGFHLFVRSNGKLIYHEYYYVPYDTESDCTDEDFIDVPIGSGKLMEER